MAKQNKKGVLWYLGISFLWIIALPIMIIRLLYKKEKLSKKTAILFGVVSALIWFPLVFSQSNSSEIENTSNRDANETSERFPVAISDPIEVKSIELSLDKSELIVGETAKLSVKVLPEKADKYTTLLSSNEMVATINSKGVLTAVGGGTATITVTSKNGVSSSVDVTVDGSKHLMQLKIDYYRDDDNNIGDEWSHTFEVNGELPSNKMVLSAKDKLSFFARFIEEDDNPDVGEVKKTYTVKEGDLTNGFEITMDLKVKENGGKNRGKAAHFIITFSFAPVKGE